MRVAAPLARQDDAGMSGNVLPFVSVIVVVRNEERNISRCLAQIIHQDYPKDRFEIIVVDGMSTDRTRELAHAFSSSFMAPKVLPNPHRSRAHGLNIGVRAARGDIIARIDAKTIIDSSYLRRCVETLLATRADNVGGVQRPLAHAPTQEAIGIAMAHAFGVGDAQFRLGRRGGFVDTVYPGCFRKEVFERVGLFDDAAPVVSEDSDLNYRIRRAGGKVFLDTGIVVYYRPRETLEALWRLYFRYGGARAGNVIKYRKLTSWRPLAPVTLVTALVVLAVSAALDHRFLPLLGAVAGVYLAADVAISAYLAWKHRKIPLLGRLCLVFPCMHLAYGLGFWRRLTQHPRRPGYYWGD